VGIDLTDLASKMKLGFLVGHEQEFDSLMNVLARPGRNNVLLVGEPGTGKETMVANLAIKIIKDEVPGNLFDKRLVALNIGNVTSGANNVGELQNRFQKLAKEMLEAGNIVLYIPNIYTLKQTNVEGAGINAADLLKPIFQSGLVPVIGTATEQEYRRLLDTDVEFAGMFEIIRLQEISEDEAIQILSYEALSLEKQYRIVISYKAIKRAVFLSKRYLRDKLLPASATDLLRETVVYIKSIGKKIVSEDDIIDMVEAKTRIPMANVTKQEAEQLLNLEDKLHQRMIDQEEAIKSVAEALREYRAGLSNKSGPIASFLFVGPTGVGKTELAKSLAVIYFGSESKMIRFDMTEYQDVESVQRFIGSPDGEKLGALTEAVRIHPFSLILLDEFEKASQNIMNLFLQVFDDGRLTDSTNRVIDFSNTIIIATSNALSSFIKEELDKGTEYKQLSEQIKLKLTSVYTPEMLNRFSKILVFKPLSPDDILEITKLQIKNLAEQIFNDKEIKLSVSDSAIAELARLGFDPVFGARPLQGVIREKIKSEIANKILKQELVSGDEIIIDFQNNEFTYTKIKIF
jgi:ATP-dependent Clp protease ATP-binding subunit ClpC